jgi:hypothetical protein
VSSLTDTSKPVTRITMAYTRDKGYRQIIATLDGPLLILRCKGLRQREEVDIQGIYEQAVKARVWAAKKARKAARGKR